MSLEGENVEHYPVTRKYARQQRPPHAKPPSGRKNNLPRPKYPCVSQPPPEAVRPASAKNIRGI